MQESTLRAIQILGERTRGRFDIWALAGDSNAAARVDVMAALLGVPKVAKAKAGVNAIRSEFYSRLAIHGNTLAAREDHFKATCRAYAIVPA